MLFPSLTHKCAFHKDLVLYHSVIKENKIGREDPLVWSISNLQVVYSVVMTYVWFQYCKLINRENFQASRYELQIFEKMNRKKGVYEL